VNEQLREALALIEGEVTWSRQPAQPCEDLASRVKGTEGAECRLRAAESRERMTLSSDFRQRLCAEQRLDAAAARARGLCYCGELCRERRYAMIATASSCFMW
jgi:hypothetical protein